jgi:hypothetical protein
MSLSRAAKKFRAQMPKKKPEAPKHTEVKRQDAPPAPQPVEPVQAIEPPAEPEAIAPVAVMEDAPASPPKKVWPAKAKRRRFVREQAEKRERTSGPALPPRSTKFTAQLLTKNLSLTPATDDQKASR